jgi:hypothetical protein
VTSPSWHRDRDFKPELGSAGDPRAGGGRGHSSPAGPSDSPTVGRSADRDSLSPAVPAVPRAAAAVRAGSPGPAFRVAITDPTVIKRVLSGIGTDRPARRRPAALDRPGSLPSLSWSDPAGPCLCLQRTICTLTPYFRAALDAARPAFIRRRSAPVVACAIYPRAHALHDALHRPPLAGSRVVPPSLPPLSRRQRRFAPRAGPSHHSGPVSGSASPWYLALRVLLSPDVSLSCTCIGLIALFCGESSLAVRRFSRRRLLSRADSSRTVCPAISESAHPPATMGRSVVALLSCDRIAFSHGDRRQQP